MDKTAMHFAFAIRLFVGILTFAVFFRYQIMNNFTVLMGDRYDQLGPCPQVLSSFEFALAV